MPESCVAPLKAQTIDIQDYFPLSQDSFWHYTGEGQPGSSTDDDFSWTPLPVISHRPETSLVLGGASLFTFRIDGHGWRDDRSGVLRHRHR